MTSIHLCLVSDQLPPNLIPALKLRPAQVWLAASPRMAEKAKILKRVLEKNGIATTIALHNLADADFSEMQRQADDLAMRLLETNAAIVLNTTGGNKLMSLAFWNTLSRELSGALEVQYCDTQHNALITLFPEQASQPLGQCLDLPTYLACYGYSISSASSQGADWQARAKQRKALSKWLGKNAHRDGYFLGALNGAAHEAMTSLEKGDYHGCRQSFPKELWGMRLEAMRQIALPDYNLVAWSEGADVIELKGLDAARYLCGGWLEEYAWHCAKDAGAYSAECSVNVRRGETPNELDVAIVHNNRMLVLECKASTLGSGGQDVQNVLHKLENLSAHVGGLFAERMLVCARSLGDPSNPIAERATSNRIQLVHGEALPNLQQQLKSWLDKP